ncbi:MAG: MerR family transcriptional regulator [Isosphaeraceae bacterium]
MARNGTAPEYSIAAVSKLTGVSCHALRVWERRYGFPIPLRSPSGHRRYSHEQVVLLRHISALSQQGRAISELIGEVNAGRLTVEAASELPEANTSEPSLSEFLDRLQAGDVLGADVCFDGFEERLDLIDLVTRVIGPALTETGERWFRRNCAIYQEHSVSGFFRRKLSALIETARRRNVSPCNTVMIGTVQGDRHEGGLLVAHLLLEHSGWRVINLGVDLPVQEYQRAIRELHPDALALSFVLSRNINKRFEEMSRLKEVPVFVGGRSILNYQKLARSYGLIPIAGSVTMAMEQMFREFSHWPGSRSPAPGPR